MMRIVWCRKIINYNLNSYYCTLSSYTSCIPQRDKILDTAVSRSSALRSTRIINQSFNSERARKHPRVALCDCLRFDRNRYTTYSFVSASTRDAFHIIGTAHDQPCKWFIVRPVVCTFIDYNISPCCWTRAHVRTWSRVDSIRMVYTDRIKLDCPNSEHFIYNAVYIYP